MIGDLTSNHSGDRHEWFLSALGNPAAPAEEFYYFTDEANTEYVSWLGYATLPKFNWASEKLRDRFIDGPDSVVAKWLKPPFNADGWRIDVANMTGRLGDVDLNAEVRQLLRKTMIDINPETVLLGESTNDASSDLQGDGWHGAMTYPSFTRPLWGWLSEPTSQPYIECRGRRGDRALVLRAADRRNPALHRGGVRRRRHALHVRHPVAGATGQHAAARHARHRTLRDPCRAGNDPAGGRPVDDAPRPAGRVRR